MTDAGEGPFGSPESDDAHLTRRLHELPRDLPMPRDVSIRIAAAIEAEAQAAQERGMLDASAAESDRRKRSAEPRGWFRRRAPQILAGVAGVGALTFGLYLAGTSGDGSDETTAADAGDTAAEEGAAQETEDEVPSLTGPVEERAPADTDVDVFTQTDPRLSTLVNSIASTGTEFEPGCGATFAGTIDARLLGSQAVDGGILVVTTVRDTATVEGWTLPSCTATAAVPDIDPVVVPRPTP